jgi:hypothetical protein
MEAVSSSEILVNIYQTMPEKAIFMLIAASISYPKLLFLFKLFYFATRKINREGKKGRKKHTKRMSVRQHRRSIIASGW